MNVKSKTEELGLQALSIYEGTTECIKNANSKEDKQLVRELLNTMASQLSLLEEYYKHPENIEDVPHL
ncbi:MAG: hypothetical protein II825_03510 [Paludibacteraceae bacterium]|nr:hypothetical protein [Paludibacteraceae bacterium]